MISCLVFTLALVTVVTEAGLSPDEAHQDSMALVDVSQRKINHRNSLAILEQLLTESRPSGLCAVLKDVRLPKPRDSHIKKGVEMAQEKGDPFQALSEEPTSLTVDNSAENQDGIHATDDNGQTFPSESQNDPSLIMTKTHKQDRQKIQPGRESFQEDVSMRNEPVDGQPVDAQSIDRQPIIGVARTKIYRVEGEGITLGSLDRNDKIGHGFAKSAQKSAPTERKPATVEGKSEVLEIVGEGVPINTLGDDGQVIQLLVSNSTKAEVGRRNPNGLLDVSSVYGTEGVRSDGWRQRLYQRGYEFRKNTGEAADQPNRKTPNMDTKLRFLASRDSYALRGARILAALKKFQLTRATRTRTPLKVTLLATRRYKE